MKNIAIIISVTLFLISCVTDREVDVSAYPIITTIGELSDYYDLHIDKSGNFEGTTLTKYFDGAIELEYSYDLLETEEYDPLFYSVTIEQERSIKDAIEVYSMGKGALKMVGNSFGQGTIEIDTLNLPGDETYYALRTFDNLPNGMFYMVREGTRIYTVIISGVYFPDHSLIYDFILPKIEGLASYNLRK